MNKRYQVFISSTYTDLKDERQLIFQTLMDLDCIPVGMEIFPAIDEEQFNYIKKIIDDSDYYLLIIAGRYGSCADDGISYTEKEFDYAVSKNIPVIVLIHGSPETLSFVNSEKEESLRIKLANFKEKASRNRLIRYWNNKEQLPGLVAINLPKTVNLYPAIGWVRGDSISSSQQVNEINSLLKENKRLQEKLSEMSQSSSPKVSEKLKSEYEIIIYEDLDNRESSSHSIRKTWLDIFKIITFNYIDSLYESEIIKDLISFINNNYPEFANGEIDQKLTLTHLRHQFRGLGLINDVSNDSYEIEWFLSDEGAELVKIIHLI